MKRLTLLLVLSLLVNPREAAAMSCVVTDGPREHIRKLFTSSEVVFSAYVEKIEHQQAQGRPDFPVAHMRVLQVWKGALKPGETVLGTAEDSMTFYGDGFVPTVGLGVLVYSGGPQPYRLSSCSRTGPLEWGTADIPLLNKLSKDPRYKLGG